jgi:hypothetical protein
MSYSSDQYKTVQEHMLTGNTAATMLLTPQAGTGSETKTHTTTCQPWMPGKAVTLKKLSYRVSTDQTGTGNNLTLNVYKGTASVGTLAVTATAELASATQSADMDIDLTTTDYVRIIALSTTTASDSNAAIGEMSLTYQDKYS